jgi:hypothetical protein
VDPVKLASAILLALVAGVVFVTLGGKEPQRTALATIVGKGRRDAST